jgi:putative salt-induced outer membrane protein YdiY
MSDKNLEQRINLKFCVKIGDSASETLAALAYGEYAMKKSSAFDRHRQFKEVRDDEQDDSRSWQPKMQRTDTDVGREGTLVCSDQILGVRLLMEELNKRFCFGGKDLHSGLTSGFSTMAVPVRMMR